MNDVQKNRPNLFIVGSMKCGTTALFQFLRRHPEISGANPKEIHYFTLNQSKGEEWYLSHFELDSGKRYFLEASPTYLDTASDTTIPKRIQSFNEDARIVALVRDPLSRSISHFHHLRTVNKIPDLQGMTFSDFIRRRWPKDSDYALLERNLSYVIGFSYFSRKIENYVDVFGSDRVFLIENEKMDSDGPDTINALLRKLDLEPLPEALLNQKIYVGVKKESDDVSLNSEIFSELYGSDYRDTLNATRATRIDL